MRQNTNRLSTNHMWAISIFPVMMLMIAPMINNGTPNRSSFFCTNCFAPCLSKLIGTKKPDIKKYNPMKKAALVEKKCQIQGINSAGLDGV